MDELLKDLVIFSEFELRDLLLGLKSLDTEFGDLLFLICQQKKKKADLLTPVVDKRIVELEDCFLKHSDEDGYLSWDKVFDYSRCVDKIIRRTEKASPQYRVRILLAALDEALNAIGSARDSGDNISGMIFSYAETLQTLVGQNSSAISTDLLHEMFKKVRESKSEAESWGVDKPYNTLLTALTKAIGEQGKF